MNKMKVLPYLAVIMAVFGGVVYGYGRLKPSIVHAQAPATQVQTLATTVKNDNEIVDAKESTDSKETDGSTGHQDVGGSTDHQFEGVE